MRKANWAEKDEDHIHCLRITKTLRGISAHCIQPTCYYKAALEIFHRKLLVCEVCNDRFLFDFETYDPPMGETRILCWKCSGAPKVGMTLEQQQLLLTDLLKEWSKAKLTELEKDYQLRISETNATKLALQHRLNALSARDSYLDEKETRLLRIKSELITKTNEIRVSRKRFKLEIQKEKEELKLAREKLKAKKDPVKKKSEEEIEFQKMKDSLTDAIEQAVRNSALDLSTVKIEGIGDNENVP